MKNIYIYLIAGSLLFICLVTLLFLNPQLFTISSVSNKIAESQGAAVGSATLVRAPYIDANGWTVFTPSTDTRRVYVSSSSGDDTNDGLSEATAVKTISRGRSLLRNQHPDWLLLKKGDVWNECPGIISGSSATALSGRSADEPMLFGTYGTALKRPQLLVDDTTGGCIKTIGGNYGGGNFIAVVGWEIYAHMRDPQSPTYNPTSKTPGGIFMLNDIDWFLAEDVWFRGVQFTFQDKGDPMRNISVRRSVFTQSGSFTHGVKNLMYEENVFDKSTWYKEEEQTVFKRSMYNAYGDGKTIFRGNIDANGSSGGIQLRFGGIAENNLWLRTPIPITIGHCENHTGGNVPGTVYNNVILGSRNINTAPRGIGIWLTSCEKTSKNGQVGPPSLINGLKIHNNIIAHNELGGEANVIGILMTGTGAYKNVLIEKNIIYDWVSPKEKRGVGLKINVPTEAVLSSENIVIRDNHFQYPDTVTGNSSAVSLQNGVLKNPSLFKFSGNRVWASTPFSVLDQGFSANQVIYKDPNRTIETYMDFLGIGGGYDEFMKRALRQSKDTWDPRFTANAVNEYIRDGFKVISNAVVDDTVLPQPTIQPPSVTNPVNITPPTTDATENESNPTNSLPLQPAEYNDQEETPTISVRLRTNNRSITLGESVTLSWTTTEATNCEATGDWTGSKVLEGRETIVPNTVGKKTYGLRCTRDNQSDSKTVTVTVRNATTDPKITPPLVITEPQNSSFTIGTVIKTTDRVNIRSAANGRVLGIQPANTTGVVKSLPKKLGDYTWVYVDFTTGVDGYVAVPFIQPTDTVTEPATPTATKQEIEALIYSLREQLLKLLQLYMSLVEN